MNPWNLDDLNFRLTLDEVSHLTNDRKDEIRRHCQTNLRFLANCVLRPASKKFIPLSERCHGKIIDSFLRPDPDKPFDEWSPIKERVTLASRGILKSTLVGGFLVQCQLCDPDIRIQVISGKLNLAKSILASGRQPFLANEVLRYLFPDWAIEDQDVKLDEFTCPRRDPNLNLRDPTLSISTFESVKAGSHCELAVLDDCTNEINCATEEMAEKCEGFYDDLDPIVEPGGYRHFFGTRWATDELDLPEIIRRRGNQFEEEHGGEKNTSYFVLPAWTVREGVNEQEHRDIMERDRKNCLHPTDVILTWPEKLSSKVLWPKYRVNPNKFNMQYLLRYRGSMQIESFPHDLLIANTRPFAEVIPLPHDRFTVINWDLAGVYSGRRAKRNSDFTCGFAAMFELSTRRMVAYDAVMEVFSSSTDMATTIVEFMARQLKIGPVGICRIEDSSGARLLQGELDRIAKEMGVPLVITWDPPESVQDSKASGIAQLAGAMKRGMVQFAANLPQRDEIFKQFEKWKPTKTRAKDDAPDCLAQIWKKYSNKIYPNVVPSMSPSEPIAFVPEPGAEEQLDPHADEYEGMTDMRSLETMTVPFARN